MKRIIAFTSAALAAMVLIATPYAANAASSSDDALAKAVSERLMEGRNDFDATSVIVTAEDGVVFLRGDMPGDREAVGRMGYTAERVPGVKRVEMQIDILEE